MVHALKRRMPELSSNEILENIDEIYINTFTFKDFIKKHTCNQVNIVQTDMEGYDFYVIDDIYELRYKPYIINFENIHMPRSINKAIEYKLESFGYNIYRHGDSTIVYKIYA